MKSGNLRNKGSSTLCLLLLVSSTTLAFAADLPADKSPASPPPPSFTWTGLYLGFSFAHTWTGSDPIVVNSTNIFDATSGFGLASGFGANGSTGARLNGFMSGGQLGYNWQFSEKFVAGLEADIQGAGVGGGGGFATVVPASANNYAVTSATLNRNLEYLGTLRGRLGYAVTPRVLIYATGGLAYGGANQTFTMSQELVLSTLFSKPATVDQYSNLVGWTAGGGGEVAVTDQLSAKLEYVYFNLGKLNSMNWSYNPLAFTNLVTGGPVQLANSTNATNRYSGHVLRAGLNYRFDWSAPKSMASGATAMFAPLDIAVATPTYSGEWKITAMPYMWAMGANGSLVVKGKSLGIDSSFIDGFTDTSAFPLAFAGSAEARNGRVSILGDFAWFQVRFSGSSVILRTPTLDIVAAGNTSIHLRQTMAFGEAAASYELGRLKFGVSPFSETAIDAYAGARYGYVGVNLNYNISGTAKSDILGASQFIAKAVRRDDSVQWVDPIVGVRFRHRFSANEEFTLRGDVGGFGVGTKFSWQVYGGYNREFEFKGYKFTSMVGYRALAIDYSTGQGEQQKGVDAIFHGPVTAVGMRF